MPETADDSQSGSTAFQPEVVRWGALTNSLGRW
jgi:hypothetical protein